MHPPLLTLDWNESKPSRGKTSHRLTVLDSITKGYEHGGDAKGFCDELIFYINKRNFEYLKELLSFEEYAQCVNQTDQHVINTILLIDIRFDLMFASLIMYQEKYTPLMWAAKNGYREIVDLLLQFADVDIQGGWVRYTPTYFIFPSGFTNIDYLLHFISLNHQNKTTALMKAAEKANADVVAALIAKGANLNLMNQVYSCRIDNDLRQMR